MNKTIIWALLVALLGFLATLGLFCLSASAGGAVWGDTSFGLLFFFGCVAGCFAAIGIFIGVVALLTDLAEKENRNDQTEKIRNRM